MNAKVNLEEFNQLASENPSIYSTPINGKTGNLFCKSNSTVFLSIYKKAENNESDIKENILAHIYTTKLST